MSALIIDTSQSQSLLALCKDGIVVSIELFPSRTEEMFHALQKHLSNEKFDFVAVGTGPGSYMGLRKGATIAKTLSFALNIPLIPFSSPLAYLPTTPKKYIFIGDAKGGEIYRITIDEDLIPSPTQLLSANQDIHGGEVIDMQRNPPLQLDRLAKHLQRQFSQKNFSSTDAVTLNYLRG